MARVQLKQVTKIYQDGYKAVDNVYIDIADHEFLILLGPSGCGKSTTLRMIAGLEEITSGELFIDGELMNNVLPKDRNIAMVFQNYALYPHMTVFENLSFGLKIRKTPKDEIKKRVKEAAEVLRITDLLKKKPKHLSGGQRQRVALGRAIIRKPKVFLFDEPLSNLDAKLRVHMRTEISALHHRLKSMVVYVTHDQVEAMTLGDKIVLMKDGVIHQQGTPLDLYNCPENLFVAGFIGSPAMNFFKADIRCQNSVIHFTAPGLNIITEEERFDPLIDYDNRQIIVGIRSENMTVSGEDSKNQQFTGAVSVTEHLGDQTFLFLKTDESTEDYIVIKTDPDSKVKIGDEIRSKIDLSAIHCFDPDTEKSILNK